jgi:hypothetical protein
MKDFQAFGPQKNNMKCLHFFSFFVGNFCSPESGIKHAFSSVVDPDLADQKSIGNHADPDPIPMDTGNNRHVLYFISLLAQFINSHVLLKQCRIPPKQHCCFVCRTFENAPVLGLPAAGEH